MEKIKKAFILWYGISKNEIPTTENRRKLSPKAIFLLLMIIFLCQDAAFCATERGHTLRPPSHFSKSTEAFIIEIASTNKEKDQELSIENLQRFLGQIRTAKDKGEAWVRELTGLKSDASREDISDALRRLIFKLHPDKFDDQRKDIANDITIILVQLRDSFNDAQKEVFISDDGSFFGAVDRNDIYRLRVMRRIKEDFFERLSDRTYQAITIPYIYAQEADVELVYDTYSRSINIRRYRSKIGEILLDENKDIMGIKLDFLFYPGLSHGTSNDSLFTEKRIHLVEQLSQEPFIALFLLHQLNNFRNHLQAIPKHARKNLSFSFDILGSNYLGAKTAGKYSYRFGIFVPLNKKYSHEELSGIGTFAHEYQHLYSDAQVDSAGEALRRIEDESLRQKTQSFYENIILTCIAPEKGEDFVRYIKAGYILESPLEYPERLNLDPKYIYHLPEVFLPMEARLALNDVGRIYRKTGKHIKTHLMEWADKNDYWIHNLNDSYYLDPNEWLAQKAQYYLTLDKDSLFDIYCEIGMEDEFLSEEDLRYFKERYGEKAYLRYLLLRAKDKGDEISADQLEVAMQEMDPNNTVFALPALNEMLTFVQSDIIYRNLVALVTRLSDENIGKQRSLSASMTDSRAEYFLSVIPPQRALPAYGAAEGQIQQIMQVFIGAYNKIDYLKAMARFLNNREPFIFDQDDTLVELFRQELEKTKELRNVLFNMSREKFRSLLRSMNALVMTRKRIEELENSVIEKYNIRDEQIYAAIQSLPSLEAVEFVRDIVDGVFTGRYPEGHQYEYIELIKALTKHNICTYQFERDSMFSVIQAILKHTDCRAIIQERIKQLETKFLQEHNITKEKVHAAIKALPSLENVKEVRDIIDGVIVQWVPVIQELFNALGKEGVNIQNLHSKDLVRLLRLTEARPVIEERLCALSIDLAVLEDRTQAAILALTESRGLISGIQGEGRLLDAGSPYNDFEISNELQGVKKVDGELSKLYENHLQLLEEVRELLMYKDDPAARDYIIRRLKVIITGIDNILNSLGPSPRENIASLWRNLSAVKSNAEDILNQLLQTQRDSDKKSPTSEGVQSLIEIPRNSL